MALNIKDAATEQLAAEVAALAGETKTRAVRIALEQRKQRLVRSAPADRGANLRSFLEVEAWPQIPKKALGAEISRAEREAILGLGPGGV